MNDKDRELLVQILHSAGSVGEQGFTYLVRYQFIDGITSFVGFGIALVAGAWLLRKVFAWKPEKGYDGDGERIGKNIAVVVLCALLFAFLCGMLNGVNAALAPEGSAIKAALGALRDKS